MIICNYGTELIGINCKEKLASTSIKTLQQKGFRYSEEDVTRAHYQQKKYVVIVRDVYERWKSGYIQDMIGAFIGADISWKSYGVSDSNNFFWEKMMNENIDGFSIECESWKGNPNELLHGLDTMTKIHKIEKDFSWMYNGGHSIFYHWNDNENHLSEFLSLENVYFVDLKNLSSDGFSKWLTDNDVTFKDVKFDKVNSKPKMLEKNIDLFWKEYLSGKIKNYYRLSDIEKLVSPFYECVGNEVFKHYYELCKATQSTLDYIKNNHDRYIKS